MAEATVRNMKTVLLLVGLAGCAGGSVAEATIATDMKVFVDAGAVRRPMPTGSDYLDAGLGSDADAGVVDAGPDGPTCDPGTVIVGNCLTHQATSCVAYYSDRSVACLATGELVSGWFPGECERTRSSGGCVDECGLVHWSYPLGGANATDAQRANMQLECEAAGMAYVHP